MAFKPQKLRLEVYFEAVSSDSARVCWNLPLGLYRSEIKGFEFELRTEEGERLFKETIPQSTAEAYQLHNLEPRQRYQVQLKVQLLPA